MGDGTRFKHVDQYDREQLWDTGSYDKPDETERAAFIKDSIPAGVKTILDVGCGSGKVTNVLAQSYETTGLDIAPAPLKYVNAKTVVGSADDLPFADRSFDAVVLAEVLEHLEEDDYERARAEAGRVASQAVIVTVPNRENLRASLVRCPKCDEAFSPWRHYRSFNPRQMRTLVPGFRLVDLQSIGPPTERVTTLESMIRGRLARGAPLPFPAVCPRCGEQGEVRQQGRQGPTYGGLRRTGIQRVLRPIRRTRWLFARYERR